MKLVILDLDETLIFSSREKLQYNYDFSILDCFYVYKRPYLDDFIESVSQNFRMAVWTSASADYAEQIKLNIFGDKKLEFFWTRKKCTTRRDFLQNQYILVKNLKKVKRSFGIPFTEILMIDDKPQFAQLNYGNLVRVTEWKGEQEDKELLYLTEYLEQFKEVVDVRDIEKRNWQQPYKSED